MLSLYRRSHCVILGGYSKNVHRHLERAINEHQYSPNAVWGFRMIARRGDSFVAEHIEKQIHEDVVTDPFGDTTIVERTEYITTTIQMKCESPHVILLDPPSTSRQVIHKLCGFLDFSIIVQQPEIDIPAWASKMSNAKFNLKADDIRMQNVDYGDGFIGALTLVGSGDVLRKANTVTKGFKHIVSAIGGMVRIENTETQIRLHRSGRIELSKGTNVDQFAALYALSDWQA